MKHTQFHHTSVSFALVLGLSLAALTGEGAGNATDAARVVAEIKDGDTLAFLGDSITAGGAAYGNFCRLVVQGLKMKGVRVKPVMAGISGNTSEHMLARLSEDVLQHKPDWVVLAVGVNDIWHRDPTLKIGVFQPKPGMGVDLANYKRNVTAIVDRCLGAGAQVILTTITPIREEPDFRTNLTAKKYNAFLYDLAKQRNLPVARLHEGMFAEIEKGVRLTSDGVHPLQEGHRVMAKGILKAMGFADSELKTAEQEWESAPEVLILGDRQTTSGGRTGGWCHLLMDGLNSGRGMVTYRTYARYRGEVTARSLLKDLQEKLEDAPRDLIFQAPRDDALLDTPLPEYRQALLDLIAMARDSGTRLILVTIAVQDNDVSSDRSRKLPPYNEILRDVAKAQKIALADINQTMTERYTADPKARLTFDGERFSRQGGVLMVETLLRAMGHGALITPGLRTTWAEREFYGD